MLLKPAFSKLLFISVLLAATSAVFGQTSAFTYQGSLSSGGSVANGQYDFQFALFDALTAGNQIGSTVSGRNWQSVASSADGTKMVAVVFPGQIYTSDPQTATTTTTTGTSGFLTGGQSSAVELQYIGNGQFLMISHEGTIVGF